MQVLNFYSTIFADELKRGRKTATIRLGDKSGKYRKNQLVLVTIGFQYSPRERIFDAVIDQVEVMKLAELSPRDIKHDNPEFRRHEELINFLEQIYGRAGVHGRHRHRRALLADHRAALGHDRGDQGLRRRAELTRRPHVAPPTRPHTGPPARGTSCGRHARARGRSGGRPARARGRVVDAVGATGSRDRGLPNFSWRRRGIFYILS